MTAKTGGAATPVGTALGAWEAGCQQCGTLHPVDALDLLGACADCARDRWDRMTETERGAWCKANRMHYRYEDKGPMPPAQRLRIERLLESHPYRFAKTMPKNPHWYTLRYEWMDVGHTVFNEVVRAIRDHGYTEWFGTYPWRMLEAGGFKYWSYYNCSVESVIVLNRKPLPDHVTEEEAASR